MQIVVNTRLLIHNKLDGIGWFSYQTLKRITQNNPDVHFVFLFDRDYNDEFIFADNVTPLVIGPQARHPFLYYAWFHLSVKNLLNRMNPDLFLSPDGFLSPGAKCKQLPVIHDINFLHNPKDLKTLTSKYYNHFFPKYAKLATRIATVSEYSKMDISKNYQIEQNKIDVVYNGINEGFRSVSATEQQATREQFSSGKPFFLFVGSQSPRKNLNRLIAAFDKFKEESKSDYKLVLVGAVYSSEGDVKRVIDKSKFKNDIIFTGRQPQEELERIMASAFALTFVPYFEGFGIPIVEALECETPVICSNTTSMPEIAGNAGLLIDPFDVNSICHGMLELYNKPSLRIQLIENGKVRKNLYSWDKSADLLWNSITKCL
ncbi:MAG: glycosyltransferase family 4 protein [Burkholderiales bacterium]|nr:glycosyltransferase family 4 protein [Bacteroidia bacterium]